MLVVRGEGGELGSPTFPPTMSLLNDLSAGCVKSFPLLFCLVFLQSLCSWDPCKRPTASEALQHPFFQVVFSLNWFAFCLYSERIFSILFFLRCKLFLFIYSLSTVELLLHSPIASRQSSSENSSTWFVSFHFCFVSCECSCCTIVWGT